MFLLVCIAVMVNLRDSDINALEKRAAEERVNNDIKLKHPLTKLINAYPRIVELKYNDYKRLQNR